MKKRLFGLILLVSLGMDILGSHRVLRSALALSRASISRRGVGSSMLRSCKAAPFRTAARSIAPFASLAGVTPLVLNKKNPSKNLGPGVLRFFMNKTDDDHIKDDPALWIEEIVLEIFKEDPIRLKDVLEGKPLSTKGYLNVRLVLMNFLKKSTVFKDVIESLVGDIEDSVYSEEDIYDCLVNLFYIDVAGLDLIGVLQSENSLLSELDKIKIKIFTYSVLLDLRDSDFSDRLKLNLDSFSSVLGDLDERITLDFIRFIYSIGRLHFSDDHGLGCMKWLNSEYVTKFFAKKWSDKKLGLDNRVRAMNHHFKMYRDYNVIEDALRKILLEESITDFSYICKRLSWSLRECWYILSYRLAPELLDAFDSSIKYVGEVADRGNNSFGNIPTLTHLNSLVSTDKWKRGKFVTFTIEGLLDIGNIFSSEVKEFIDLKGDNFNAILSKESSFDRNGFQVFYHGQASEYGLQLCLRRMLGNSLANEGLARKVPSDFVPIQSCPAAYSLDEGFRDSVCDEACLEHESLMKADHHDKFGERPSNLFSANAYLFANATNKGSCTYQYINKNKNVRRVNNSIYKNVFRDLGVSESIYSKYRACGEIKELGRLYNEAYGATLLQVALPKDKVNGWSYLATSGAKKVLRSYTNAAGIRTETDKPAEYLEFFGSTPFEFIDKAGEVAIPLTAATVLNPDSGVKVIDYPVVKDVEKAKVCQEKMQELVLKIVDDMKDEAVCA